MTGRWTGQEECSREKEQMKEPKTSWEERPSGVPAGDRK